MDSNNQLVTLTVDLLAPSSRWLATSRLFGRLHRQRLLLRRYWWVGGLILVLMAVPAYYLTLESPRSFESKAKMWLACKLELNEGRLYTEELVNFLGTQVELLRSGPIQQRALARVKSQFTNAPAANFKAAGHAQFRPVQEVKDIWRRFLAAAGVEPSTNAQPESPFQLKIVESAKSSILEMRARGPEPAATQAYLTYLMEEYLKFKREAREKVSDRTLTSITEQVGQLTNELKTQQEKLYAFQMSNNVVFLQEQGNSAGSYLALLNKQLATLRTESQFLQLLQPEEWIEAAAKKRNGESSEVSGSTAANQDMLSNLAGPQTDLFKATQQAQLIKAKREELSRYLRPLHPKIVKLDEEIGTQEKLAQISREEAARQLAQRRHTIQLEIQNLEAAFKEWDAKALHTSRKMVEYDRIRQDLQRLQGAYDKLLGVVHSVDVGKKLDQENVSVLEPASAPRPQRRMLRNMLASFAAAFFFSAVFFYFAGRFDDRFASLSELDDDLSETAIGQIPEIALKGQNGKLSMEMLEKQRFEFLEAFRSIRSLLLSLHERAVTPKIIMIGISVPKEGKSTVATYLAATLSLGGSSVLLIDADMRRSSLHKYCGLRPSPGLAEVLAGESSTPAILSTTLENLSLLTAGDARRNPGEFVLQGEWAALMKEVRPHFDYVIIDTPPLLATDDAATLARQVDTVLFVVRGSFTSARMARRALDVLKQRRIPVLGLVFNRAKFSRYENHYYGQYRASYGWRPKRGRNAKPAAALTAKTAIGLKRTTTKPC